MIFCKVKHPWFDEQKFFNWVAEVVQAYVHERQRGSSNGFCLSGDLELNVGLCASICAHKTQKQYICDIIP